MKDDKPKIDKKEFEKPPRKAGSPLTWEDFIEEADNRAMLVTNQIGQMAELLNFFKWLYPQPLWREYRYTLAVGQEQVIPIDSEAVRFWFVRVTGGTVGADFVRVAPQNSTSLNSLVVPTGNAVNIPDAQRILSIRNVGATSVTVNVIAHNYREFQFFNVNAGV